MRLARHYSTRARAVTADAKHTPQQLASAALLLWGLLRLRSRLLRAPAEDTYSVQPPPLRSGLSPEGFITSALGTSALVIGYSPGTVRENLHTRVSEPRTPPSSVKPILLVSAQGTSCLLGYQWLNHQEQELAETLCTLHSDPLHQSSSPKPKSWSPMSLANRLSAS